MNNSYEIIGNQIKYYLRDDLTRGWNNIPSLQFRNVKEITEWCGSSTNEIMCGWDALNQNAMSTTDTTDFLYRWISWYLTEPLGSTAQEMRKLLDELASFITHVPVDAFELIKNTSHMVLDCICFVLDWIPNLLTIFFLGGNMLKRKETISFQAFIINLIRRKSKQKYIALALLVHSHFSYVITTYSYVCSPGNSRRPYNWSCFVGKILSTK